MLIKALKENQYYKFIILIKNLSLKNTSTNLINTQIINVKWIMWENDVSLINVKTNKVLMM